jgi:hypothetical protein
LLTPLKAQQELLALVHEWMAQTSLPR